MSLKVAERNPGKQLPHCQRRNFYHLDMTNAGRQVASHHHVFRELPACARLHHSLCQGRLAPLMQLRKKWEAWKEAVHEQ